MRDLDIENGMLLWREKPYRAHTCKNCGTEWEEVESGFGDRVTYASLWQESDTYPIDKGFCRACAVVSATPEDRALFIKQNGLEREFLSSLLSKEVMGTLRNVDVMVVWETALKHEPDVLDQRLDEYIDNGLVEKFTNWRFG